MFGAETLALVWNEKHYDIMSKMCEGKLVMENRNNEGKMEKEIAEERIAESVQPRNDQSLESPGDTPADCCNSSVE